MWTFVLVAAAAAAAVVVVVVVWLANVTENTAGLSDVQSGAIPHHDVAACLRPSCALVRAERTVRILGERAADSSIADWESAAIWQFDWQLRTPSRRPSWIAHNEPISCDRMLAVFIFLTNIDRKFWLIAEWITLIQLLSHSHVTWCRLWGVDYAICTQ